MLLIVGTVVLSGAGCVLPPTAPLKPRTVAEGCMNGGCGGELCCDASRGGLGCMSNCVASPKNYCNRYLRTCRVQTDGHCGWDADELERDKQCVENEDFPAWEE